MYRIGYRTASFGNQGLREAFQALGALGYDSVELCLEREEIDPLGLTAEKAEEVLEAAQRSGLTIHSVSYHGDGQEWAARAERQLAAVKVAPWFGVKTIVVNTPPASADVDAEAVVQDLYTVAEAAERAGVRVAVEPEPGLVVGTVADALRVVTECPSHSLAVNLDVGHAFLTEPDLPAAIASLRGLLAHTHFEDMPAGEHRHCIPGEGDLDLVDTILALWDAGFRGVLTLDLFGPFDDPLAVAQKALSATRKVLREAYSRAHPRS